MKICTKCKEEKELENFGFNSRIPKKILSECKKCVAIRSRLHYEANREKSNERRKNNYFKNREIELKKQKEYYWKNRTEIRKKVSETNKNPENRKKNNERVKKWNKENPDRVRETARKYNDRNPEKKKAQQYVLWALRLGVISKPNQCEDCRKDKKLEGHHSDYSKYLEVIWLCKLCHAKRHTKDKICRPLHQQIQQWSSFEKRLGD